jgi:DNA-binding MarR family transcriptional regulator
VQATVATPQQLAAALNNLSTHINRTASPEMFRVLGELDMSFTQVKAMFALMDVEDATVKHLAERLNMSLPAMSRSVDGLVQRGYVERKECPSDRRSKRIALLPAGRDALRHISAAREAGLVEFAAELSDAERTALYTAILPIAERISSP